MKNRKTEYCKMAREAVLQGDRYFGQRDYRGASVFYLKASQLGSKEGNKKYRQVQELLGDSDLVNPAQYAKNQKKNYVTMESPKMKASLSMPSDGARILIEERTPSQQKPKTQQKKTEEKPKPENSHGNNVEELLKKAQELETKGNKKEAFQLTKKAADNGHPEARAKVGQWYLERALRYLGQQSILEKLEEKNPPQKKADKSESSVAPKPHFRHQRNRIAELNGCGDMPETETSDLHAEQAGETTWVGAAQKNNPSTPEVIIQEVVRYVTYWWGSDCLPPLICIDRQEPEACECPMKSGQEFSAEGIVWQEIPPAVATEEASRLMKAKEEEQQPKHGCMGILFLIFKKLFSIFRK